MPLGLDVRAVPADAWDIVSDLVAADTLCRVCRGLREVLGRRYVTVSGSPSVEQLETILGTVRAITLSWDQEPPDHSCFAKIMTALGEAPRLKTLTVQTRLQRYRWEPLPPGRYSADDLLIMPQLQPLTPLGASSSLHGLALHLRAGDFGDSDVPPILGPLSAVRPLRSLTLDLFDNQLETPGAQALVAILTAIPGLCALHLNMGYNALDCTGAKALAGLKNAPALETLSLQLLGANLGLDAAQAHYHYHLLTVQALSGLKDAPNLRTLSLNLGYSEVGDRGASSLAALQRSPTLHTLTLNLSHADVTYAGAAALAALHNSPRLHTLSLDLSISDHMGPRGAQGLATLRHSHTLRSLTLCLRIARVRDLGAQALAELRQAPHLHTLTLDLWQSRVGDVGARALASLATAPALTWLSLDLSHNEVTHLGVQALVEAVNQSPALRCLTLKLEGSCGGDQSAHALAALKDAPTLEALTLCLSGLYNSGAQALGTLREASKLRTLDLDLRDTGVGHAGVEALRRLCGEPGVKARQQVVVRCSLMMGTILCECADCTGFLIPESLPPGTVLAGYKKIS